MKIIADENIPYVEAAFSHLGEVQTVAGRQISQANLGQAEVLLVRSVTQVNKTLLAGSAVRFVGTATIGLDHIDLKALQQAGIGFASAPGCNATAAAEYVISALLVIAERQGFQLKEKTVGIVGCGNVGSRVFNKLKALGVDCLCYDPPLQEQTGQSDYVDLETLFSADILTLHVPLEKGGRYPTYHLVNKEWLSRLKEEVILINTSRGPVVDEAALLAQLEQCPQMTVILDVWPSEPQINPLLLRRAALGTPHIAGYSFDGKVRGTEMIYTAACHYFQQTPTWTARNMIPPSPLTRLSFSTTVEDEAAIHTAVMACYDVRRDDAALRRMFQTENLSAFFDQLRKNYPVRREFNQVEIELPQKKSVLATQLQGLGFQSRIVR